MHEFATIARSLLFLRCFHLNIRWFTKTELVSLNFLNTKQTKNYNSFIHIHIVKRIFILPVEPRFRETATKSRIIIKVTKTVSKKKRAEKLLNIPSHICEEKKLLYCIPMVLVCTAQNIVHRIHFQVHHCLEMNVKSNSYSFLLFSLVLFSLC